MAKAKKSTQGRAQFTPGPWFANQSEMEAHSCKVEIRTTNGAYLICSDAGYQNAPLIAAAPAMYLELKEGLVLLEASHHDMVDMYGTDSLQAKTVWERIESTRNTLAQAEGRQA